MPQARAGDIDVIDSPTSRLPQAAPVTLDAHAFQIQDLVGLHEADAQARLQQDGPNELPAQQKRNLLTIVLEVVREPMFLMLVAAGVVYLLHLATDESLLTGEAVPVRKHGWSAKRE
jgi:magnesium-transporting ATPase (P-type)